MADEAGENASFRDGRTLPSTVVDKIFELAANKRTPMQIVKHYSLADLGLDHKEVEDILQKNREKEVSNAGPKGTEGGEGTGLTNVDESETITHAPDILKLWMDSAKNNDVQTMEALLIEHRSLLNSKQAGIGNTAMHWAAFKDHTQAVHFLVSRGANLVARNNSGATPLHTAAANGSVESVRILLEKNSCIDLQDSEGRTAGELAKLRHTHIMQSSRSQEQDKDESDAVFMEQRLGEIVELLELPALATRMKGSQNWSVADIKRLLSLAGKDTSGLMEKSDYEASCRQFLEGIAEGTMPIRPRQAARFAQNERSDKAPGGGVSEGKSRASVGSTGTEKGAGGEGTDKVARLKTKGNEAFANKDFESAVRHYSMALRLEQDNHVLLSNRAAAYLALEEYQEALQDASLACELAPEWPKAHSRKGAALLALGKYAQAADAYSVGLQLEPDNKQMRDALQQARKLQAAPLPKRTQAAEPPRQEEEAHPTHTDESLHGIPVHVGKRWIRAARHGDAQVLQQMLQHQAQLPHEGPGAAALLQYAGEGTSYSFFRHTALHWCAARGHIKCMELLIGARADIDARNRAGSTPLHSAAHRDAVDSIKVLITCGADAHARDLEGLTPAAVAAKLGSTAAAAYFAEAQGTGGSDESVQKDQAAQTPSDDKQGSVGDAQGVGAACAGISDTDKHQVPPAELEHLHVEGNKHFSAHEYDKAVECYTQALAQDARNHVVLSNRSAALLALNYTERALQDAKACVALAPDWPKGYSRKGAAHLAHGDALEAMLAYRRGLELDPGSEGLKRGLADALARLRALTSEYDDLPSDEEAGAVDKGARQGTGGDTQSSAATPHATASSSALAAEGGSATANTSPSSVQGFCFPRDINFDSTNIPRPLGLAFMDAAKRGDRAGLERMLVERPDLLWYRGQGTSYGFVGHSVAHWTASQGHMDCLMVIIAAGGDLNARNRGGSSVLHSAAMNDRLQCVQVLLRCGADPTACDQDGETPDHCARRRGKVSAADAIATFIRSGKKAEGAEAVWSTCERATQLREWVLQLNHAKQRWVTQQQSSSKQDVDKSAASTVIDAAQTRRDGDKTSGQDNRESQNEAMPQGESVSEKRSGVAGTEESRASNKGRGKEAAARKTQKGAKEESSSSDDEMSEEQVRARVESMGKKGSEAFARKDYTAAAAAYSIAVNFDKNNYKMVSNRSAAYAGAGDYEKALEDAKKVIKLAPDWARGYSRLGAALHGLQRWKEAFEAYSQGLKIEPDNKALREGRDTTGKSLFGCGRAKTPNSDSIVLASQECIPVYA